MNIILIQKRADALRVLVTNLCSRDSHTSSGGPCSSAIITAINVFLRNPYRGVVPESLNSRLMSLKHESYIGTRNVVYRAIDVKEVIMIVAAMTVELKKIIQEVSQENS